MADNEYKNNSELNEITSILAKSKPKKKIIIISIIIAIFLISSPFIAKFVANIYTGSKLSSFFNSFKGQCNIIYEKSDYNIFTRHLIVSNMSIICQNDEVARFDTVDFAHIVSGSPLPANISAQITGGTINFNSSLFAPYNNLISDFGITNANFSGHIAATLGPSSKIFRIERLNFNFDGLGSLEAEFQVNNIDSYTTLDAVDKIFINNFSFLWVSFHDNGLVNKILSSYGDYTNLHTDIAKDNAIYALDRRILNIYEDEELMRNNLIQIKRFFSNPSTISFKTDDNLFSLSEVINNFNYDSWRRFITSLELFPFEIKAE